MMMDSIMKIRFFHISIDLDLNKIPLTERISDGLWKFEMENNLTAI